jgi:hypothetical protein
MCKHKSFVSEQPTIATMPMMATEGAYEGQTVRLDSHDRVLHQRRERGSCGGHGSFPWWTLWLIWPLIGLAKWFVTLYLGAITVGLTQLSANGVVPFVAIALIVIGLVLIRRRQ